MIETCLVCDRCGTIIAGAKTGKQAREDAVNIYQRRHGKDICTACEPLPHNRRRPYGQEERGK